MKSPFVCATAECPARKELARGLCAGCYTRKRRLDKLLSQADKGHCEPVTDKYRYPAMPLLRHATGGTGTAYWALVFGVTAQAIDWCLANGLSWRTADKMACHIGIHPGLIWPDWFERGYMDGRMDQEGAAA